MSYLIGKSISQSIGKSFGGSISQVSFTMFKLLYYHIAEVPYLQNYQPNISRLPYRLMSMLELGS